MRLLYSVLASAVLAVTPLAAQQPLTAPGPRCVLPVPGPGEASAARHADAWDPAQAEATAALLRRPRTATFEVTYEGFSPEAQAAFAYAVAIWERHVASDVPIRIQARWAELEEDLLGSAGPRLLSYDGSAPRGLEPNTWYPYALADAIVGSDIQDGADDFDISATFNSAFDRWHFAFDTPAPANRFDFATVVLHELGHGLGFIGAADVFGQQGEVGLEGENGRYPYAYDLYVQDAAGQSLLDTAVYPNDSRALGDVLTGGALFFDGVQARAANGGDRPQLYAPDDFLAGTSYSHLDENTFARGNLEALMTPFLSPGERFETPGAVTCGLFADMGWPLGPGCGGLVPVSPLPVFAVRVFPNPSTGAGCVAIEAGDLGEPGEVTVTVYDVLGRQVVQGASRAAVGETQDGCSLSSAAGDFNTAIALPQPSVPGVYLVRVRSEDYNSEGRDFDETMRWTVLR